jgi:hypothetical protein
VSGSDQKMRERRSGRVCWNEMNLFNNMGRPWAAVRSE